MSLRSIIKKIQKIVGTKPDGIFGPVTAMAVLAHLRVKPLEVVETSAELIRFDERTERNLQTLTPKAQEKMRPFIAHGKAVAATMGFDFIGISGSRTYAEQDALYAQGRSKPGDIVTKARGGYSWHNFKNAMDFGVFKGKDYIDGSDRKTAHRVHAAIGQIAKQHGIVWGGSWTGFKDTPHYHVKLNKSMATCRKLVAAGKEVL